MPCWQAPCQGSRGVELAEKIHLSRPAVSHHLQILKEAGIVRARREGTYIYYYLNPQDGEIQRVLCVSSSPFSRRWPLRQTGKGNHNPLQKGRRTTMELWEAMERRHSVRAYQNRPIAGEVKRGTGGMDRPV